MSSGYGCTGKANRCYTFWREYMNCLTDPQNICKEGLEDYLECLHNHKTVARRNLVALAAQRRQIIETEGLQAVAEGGGHGDEH